MVVLLIYPSFAQALYVQELSKRYALNDDSQDLGEIFMAMNDTTLPITKTHGITLILSAPQWYLWERGVLTLTASGNAVERGKMALNPSVNYSADLKSATISIAGDFAVGDEVSLTGLKVKVYNRGSGYQPIAIDLTGDGVGDYESPIKIRVDDQSEKTDRVPPYSPQVFTAELLENPWRVDLSWIGPIDYDFEFFDLEKTVGDTTTLLFESSGLDLKYTDREIEESQHITYTLYAKDRRNRSDPVTQTIIVAKAISEPQDNTSNVTPEETDTQNDNQEEVSQDDTPQAPLALSQEERALLTKLFNYYRIRYQIKCLPSGRTVSAGDSACLWAKIDLVYAQERLGRSDVTATLSARDAGFIGSRLPYSESRYQTQCVGTASSARFCPNLKRAIDRANYFLNK